MITYREKGEYGLIVPVLHKVHFVHYDRVEVYKWCEGNCKAAYYPGPSWAGSFYEFEDDEDAMWFRLRWS